MADKKPTPQENMNRILGKLSHYDAIRLGTISGKYQSIKHSMYPVRDLAAMMANASSQLKTHLPQSSYRELEDLSKNTKNLYKPFSAFEYLNQNRAMLDSILGPKHSFYERQSFLINSIKEYLTSDFISNSKLYGWTEEWQGLLSKGILGATLDNQPDLDVFEIEDKIENTLQEEEALLKDEKFTEELRESFDKEFSSTYKLFEHIEKELTFLFYKLMHRYGLSVQAARNMVQMIMWASGLYIGTLAKDYIIPEKENHKPKITHIHKTYNNYYTINNIDTVTAKVPVYRRSSDKTKRHATIPQDSIVSVFKKKGEYSLVETVIDSTESNKRRIIRGWIKNDSLKSAN